MGGWPNGHRIGYLTLVTISTWPTRVVLSGSSLPLAGLSMMRTYVRRDEAIPTGYGNSRRSAFELNEQTDAV
jgi:hypothetical protein